MTHTLITGFITDKKTKLLEKSVFHPPELVIKLMTPPPLQLP